MDTNYQPEQNSFSQGSQPVQPAPATQFTQTSPQSSKTDGGHKIKGTTVMLLLLALLALVVGVSTLIAKNNRASVLEQEASVYWTPKSLKFNSTGEDVETLQNFLIEKGFYSGSASGVFDVATKNASIAYKTSIGINPQAGQFSSGWSPITGSGSSTSISACKVDFDQNGEVGIDDYLLLEENMSPGPITPSLYDLDNDSDVDGMDRLIFMKKFGWPNNCITSNVGIAYSIPGTPSSLPSPTPNPSGSNWDIEDVTNCSADDVASLWNGYKTTTRKVFTYKQVNTYQVQSNGTVVPQGQIWTTATTTNPFNFVGPWLETLSNYENTSIKSYQGKNWVVYEGEMMTDPNTGLQWQTAIMTDLVPTSSNEIGSFDVVLEKDGNELINNTMVNKMPIGSFGSTLPKLLNSSAANFSPWIHLGIYNDGTPSNLEDFTSDENYIFTSFTDPRLESFNLATGTEASYNPSTNTITYDPAKGAAVMLTYFRNSEPQGVSSQSYNGPLMVKTPAFEGFFDLNTNEQKFFGCANN